jgi:ribosomal protein S18 acetylase RimI-like enzyme
MINLRSQASTPWLAEVQCRYLVQDDLPALEWDGEYARFRRLYCDIYQSFSQGKAVMWVATLPVDGLIGQLFVQLRSTRLELADGKTRAYLYGFRVKSSFRGVGVGSTMLEQAEEDLLPRGFSLLSLNVGRNNPNARRFYERHGYCTVGSEAGRWSYLDDQGQQRQVNEPAWRMEKVLRRC